MAERENLQKSRRRIDGIGQQHRSQHFTGRRIRHCPRQESDALVPGDREIHQHYALAGFLLAHHRVKQLAHRSINLGHNRQPLERSLKKRKGLPAHYLRCNPANDVQHHQREQHRQSRLQPRMVQPVRRKDEGEEFDQRQARLRQESKQEAEDQIGDE